MRENPIVQAAALPSLDDSAAMIGEAAFERPLFDVFADLATRQPDHLAVDDGTGSLTYAALHDRALALGARIAVQFVLNGLAETPLLHH